MQFNKFGFIPRSLIKLAETGQKPVTNEECREQFGDRFQNLDNQYGLLHPAHIPEIARELKLPGEAGVPPRKLVSVSDYDQVATLRRTGSKIMVASHIDLNLGGTSEGNHCCVLHAIDVRTFTLWTPSQDGKDCILSVFPRSWAEKKCQGMVLI